MRRMSAASETDSLKPSQSVAFGHVEEVEFEKRSRVSDSKKVAQGTIKKSEGLP